MNKPADAGVLSRVNSPVNCKEAVHTARITEGVEEHGLGEVPGTAGSGHGAAVIFPAYKEGVRTIGKKLSGVQRKTCSRTDRGRRSELCAASDGRQSEQGNDQYISGSHMFGASLAMIRHFDLLEAFPKVKSYLNI